MDDNDRHHGLTRLLAGAARAHHEATGGTSHDWDAWYGEFLHGQIDEFVGFSPPIETIREWLVAADERQRAEDPDGHWPSFYATLILDEYADD